MKDDTISRAAAIDAMMKLQAEDIEAYGASIPEGFDGDRAVTAIKALPPAQLAQDLTNGCTDTISRVAAWDALGERPVVWSDNDDYTLGERNQYDMDRLAIETVPSAQPVEDARAMCGECDAWNKYKNYPQPMQFNPCTVCQEFDCTGCKFRRT